MGVPVKVDDGPIIRWPWRERDRDVGMPASPAISLLTISAFAAQRVGPVVGLDIADVGLGIARGPGETRFLQGPDGPHGSCR